MAAELCHHRRQLHRIPEEGYHEEKTQQYLLRFLENLGVDEVRVFAATGVRALIKAENPAGTLAFRADMDALCVTEETGLPFASEHAGYMHACGHDGHMALLLGLARLAMEQHAQLRYNLLLLFQPAEESVGGAARMIEEGALQNPKPDRLFGFHLFPDVPLGKIGLRAGPMMAQACEFDILIHGAATHGATPHKGADAIAAGCQLFNDMQTILTRTIDPYETAVLTIGRMCGGARRNVLADTMLMEGTLRTFSEEVFQKVETGIKQKVESIPAGFGATATYNRVVLYPLVDNPAKETGEVIALLGKESVVEVKPQMIAEDFSFFQRALPAVYMFLGTGQQGDTQFLHSSRFDFNETALLYGLEVYARLAGLSDCVK